MPLNKAGLEAQIKSILAPSNNTENNYEKVAKDLANAIDTYVKGMTITATGYQATPINVISIT
ncbi:hypothetical protein [Tenacibaculum sp. M341]|uniref:hypothetical protein n=1 Tax=Tenacibaculum sp. M341 TaxID=2530339 RepID=UPI00104936B3|nr:hypothetical protein [Tenacibaculum sp. M341]TCI93682.1 hypothetical protein EYW44_04510 [Tenacibaculum sp. M341]